MNGTVGPARGANAYQFQDTHSEVDKFNDLRKLLNPPDGRVYHAKVLVAHSNLQNKALLRNLNENEQMVLSMVMSSAKAKSPGAHPLSLKSIMHRAESMGLRARNQVIKLGGWFKQVIRNFRGQSPAANVSAQSLRVSAPATQKAEAPAFSHEARDAFVSTLRNKLEGKISKHKEPGQRRHEFAKPREVFKAVNMHILEVGDTEKNLDVLMTIQQRSGLGPEEFIDVMIKALDEDAAGKSPPNFKPIDSNHGSFQVIKEGLEKMFPSAG